MNRDWVVAVATERMAAAEAPRAHPPTADQAVADDGFAHGSAADAQHMAAELVGRMLVEREALPAIALTTDTSNITAISNDYGYDLVFSRQVEALGKMGDMLIVFSTSGNSKNVIYAIESAHKRGLRTVAVTGGNGGFLADLYKKGKIEFFLCATEGENSSQIQETHISVVHSLVDVMDRFFINNLSNLRKIDY